MLRFSLKFKAPETVTSLQRQLARAGQDTSVIPDAPVLSETLGFYYDAFFDLCTTRINGMGLSPISILHVDQYAYNRQYTKFQLYFINRAVRAMDTVYMEHHAREHKSNKGVKKSR